MTYRKPGVQVTVEYQDATPQLAAFSLPNVHVGPIFQVVPNVEAGDYAAAPITVAFPNQMQGTLVDLRTSLDPAIVPYPVQINLKNTIVRIAAPVATGAVLISNLNQFTDVGAFTNVIAGDVIVITGSGAGNNGSYTVRQKISNDTVRVNETFAGAETAISYSVRRNVGTQNIPTSTAGVTLDVRNGVSLPATLNLTLSPFGSVPIVSGRIVLSYRALRYDYSADVQDFASTDDLQAAFGVDQIVPENIAVYSAFLGRSNAAIAVNILGLNQGYLDVNTGLDGDELVAYSNAFDILAMTDMFAINPCTQNPAVHTLAKAHVETLSQPQAKRERVATINRKLVTTAVVLDNSLTNGVSNLAGTIVTSATANFITGGVVPGHYINITLPAPQAGRYKIGSVDSQTQITLDTGATPIPGGVVSGLNFFVDKDLSKTEQATVLQAYAHSIGSKYVVMTWPDLVKIPVGSGIRTLPGYFLSSSVVALTTGLPTQQGLTNLSVSVYQGLVHSTKYFNDDQLDIIADGGVMIFAQEVLNVSAPYIRHQLTTDRSAIKFQEYSVTKNVCFIQKFIRQNHQIFIGQYNIVEGTFDDLRTAAKANTDFLRDSTRRPKIGGVIKSGRLVELSQDPVNIDTVVERYKLDIPIPLNNLDITIVV